MSSHAKLSTSSRVLTALALLLILSFAFAMIPSTSDAKRPKKETPTPKTEPIPADTSAYDSTLPPPDEFIALTVQPEMIYQEVPIYPPEFKDRPVTGKLWIKAGIDKRGVVRAVYIAESCGIQALDDAAVAAAWKYRFKPALQGDTPVAAWVKYSVRFSDGADSDIQMNNNSPKIRGDLDSTLPGPEEFVEVDSMPEMIYQESPAYPREAKSSNQTGTVWVKVLVDQKGTVRSVTIHKSSGHRLLDDSAKTAAWNNRFVPAKKNGQPVAAWITYRIDFRLWEE